MGARLLVRSCWDPDSSDEAAYEFDQTRITIGRGRGADVRLPHRAVSVRHATIEHTGRGYVLVDHSTTNGTRVGGARVVPGRQKPLRDGDRIELGGFSIVISAGIPVSRAMSVERTASLARRLARVSLEDSEEVGRPFITILNGPHEGRRHAIPDAPARLVVGRGEDCDLILDDADLSREHAELEVSFDGVSFRDLGSKNGIFLGGRRVADRLLDDRDELRLGATVLRFEDPAGAAVSALEEGDDDEVETPRWVDPEPPEEAEPAEEEGAEAAPPTPEPRVRRPSRPSDAIAPADMVIYVLASVVFAVSILGLIWLLRSG